MAGTGNNNVHRGPARDKPYRDALRLEIAAALENHKGLRAIARAHIAKAMEGDMNAIKELADRIDGKVAQAIKGDEDDDTAIRLEVIKRIIVGSSEGTDS